MHRTRSPYYMEKPRSYRQDQYVSLRTEINADRHGHGVFRAYHYLQGMNGIEDTYEDDFGPTSDFECMILSRAHKKEGVIYYLEIKTVEHAVRCHLKEVVRARLDARLKQAGVKKAYGGVEFTHTIIVHPNPPLEEFGGKTVDDLKKEEWGKIVPSDWQHITESAQVDFKVPGNAYVQLIVPYERLTLHSVLATIERFYQMEEKPFSFPVDWSEIIPKVEGLIERGKKGLRF